MIIFLILIPFKPLSADPRNSKGEWFNINSILGFDLAHGGHLTHGSPVNYSGKIYRPLFYGVKKEDGYIDYDSLEKTAKNQKDQNRHPTW